MVTRSPSVAVKPLCATWPGVLPLALHQPGCQLRGAAMTALDHAQRRWRLAYLSQSLGAIEAAVGAGLAITVGKAGLRGKGLDILGLADGLPALPAFDVALHRAPMMDQTARLPFKITSAMPPRMASDAASKRALTGSPSMNTAPAAAITGTLSCTVAAVVVLNCGRAAYQIA